MVVVSAPTWFDNPDWVVGYNLGARFIGWKRLTSERTTPCWTCCRARRRKDAQVMRGTAGESTVIPFVLMSCSTVRERTNWWSPREG